MNRLNIIQAIVDKIGAKIYVEIGVRSGTVFLPLKVRHKIGIDPDFQIPRRAKLAHIVSFLKSKFLKMTSDTFFSEYADDYLKNGIDVAFIDGMHTYDQSLKDVKNCLKHLNKNGVIVLHDCNPASKTGTIVPLELAKKEPDFSNLWWGDVWKTVVNLRSTRDDLNVFVLNADHGLGIIRKGRSEKMLNYSVSEIDSMTYDDLDANRVEILNLKELDSKDVLLEKI